MKVRKIYLETSVLNAPFATDAPKMQEDAIEFFKLVEQGIFLAYTSIHVVRELERAPEPKRRKMEALMDRLGIEVLTAGDGEERLAEIYVDKGMIPRKYDTDALHIASATTNRLNYIASDNFKHIVKRKTVIMTREINRHLGYNPLKIVSPTEVIQKCRDLKLQKKK